MTISERTYQVIIGILVLVILAGLAYKFRSNFQWAPGNTATTSSTQLSTILENATPDTDTPASDLAAQTTPVSETVSNESVTVNEQSSGSEVAVASVTFSKPGWVAIRDNEGRTLGAGWFDSGTHTNVTVPLLRATASGTRYQVLLYIDDGDKQFDLRKDTLVSNADGSIGGTLFTTK